MPLPTPFHPRTSQLCELHNWRNWAGYFSASSYEPVHDREYFAIRNSAAMIDVSPLYKYDITGPDALRLVDRLVPRDVTHCKIGKVLYSPWCDDDGKVIDDGTIARLDTHHFRITAALPSLRWFQDVGYGMDAQVLDVSDTLTALALQGPKSRQILQAVFPDMGLESLQYYHIATTKLDGVDITISRTGYTGDLGFEIWIAAGHAVQLWDTLIQTGTGFGITPTGILGLDIARIEAGMIMLDVDYFSAHHSITANQSSSPYDLGLDWTVHLDRGEFIGKRALTEEFKRGPVWNLVGVRLNWKMLEEAFANHDLPLLVAGSADRSTKPVYLDGVQIGQITSSTFSPLLKETIGLATIDRKQSYPGNTIDVEFTVEFNREMVQGTVVQTPFFNPPRKRA